MKTCIKTYEDKENKKHVGFSSKSICIHMHIEVKKKKKRKKNQVFEYKTQVASAQSRQT